MTDDLKAWLDQEPFEPFRIVLTSGVGYDVFSPYQISMGQTQLNYYYPKSDRKALLRLNQIASIKTLEESKA